MLWEYWKETRAEAALIREGQEKLITSHVAVPMALRMERNFRLHRQIT